VAGNRVPNNFNVTGKGPDLFGAFASEGHNLIGNNADSTGFTAGDLADLVGTSATPIDALLAPLRNNGGITHTHSLNTGSPAIDAGDDSITGTDQRGAPRLADAHVDIGAFESNYAIVSFATAESEVSEGAGSVAVLVRRSEQLGSSVTVQFSTYFRAATAGSDFTTVSDTVHFPAGETEATITVPILQDTLPEAPEDFSIQFTSTAGNPVVGPIISHKVTILDDEPPPTIEFAVAASTVSEVGGNTFITVVRSANTAGPVSVFYYTTSNGSATAGSDYIAKSGTLQFPAGIVQQTISVPILNDSLFESDESFTIQLSAPTNRAILGAITTHAVTIVSDDLPPALSFESSSSTVYEGNGSANVTITRAGAVSEAVSVTYQTSPGSAEINSDFIAVSGTVSFPAGETQATIVIPIVNDDVIEGSESFNLSLSSPTNPAVLGEHATHTVTILDNDEPAVVAFAASASTRDESAGSASIVVSREGNLSIPFTVTISSGAGSAADGSDFSGVTQTLSFPAGTTNLTVPVAILDDSIHEDSETFSLTLSSPSDGVALGTVSTHEVTIFDNDPQIPTVLNATYRGLLESENGLERGLITITTNEARRVSGVVHLHGKQLRIRASVAADGTSAQIYPTRPNRLFEGGTLTFRLNGDSTAVTGSFARADGTTFELLAKRDKNGTRTAPVAETGSYTSLLTPTSSANAPVGSLRVLVNATGRLSLTGVLPDGTPVSASSHLAGDGTFPFFAPCYAEGQGLAGIAQITTNQSLSVTGEHRWSKPSSQWQAGFQNAVVEMIGAKYRAPKNARMLDDYDASAGSALFQIETMLSQAPWEVPLLWSVSNGIRALATTPTIVRISTKPKTGLFSGSLVDEFGFRCPFRGACIQQPGTSADLAAGLYVLRRGHSTYSHQVKITPAFHN
jgi:hypothetical protein